MLAEYSLEGKVALVRAASTPIGRAIAVALAEAGADIALVCGNAPEAEETASAVRQLGRRAVLNIAPVTAGQDDVQRIFDQVISDLGRLDILVNAQGMAFARPFLETTDDQWERLMEVNFSSNLPWCRVVGQHLVAQGTGSIINVTSAMAERAVVNCSAFSVAKAAVTQLTRALAVEWARTGVRVNAIGLGWVEGEGFATDPLLRYIPQRRAGRAEDIGAAAIYLASDASAYINGEVIYIEGGVMSHV